MPSLPNDRKKVQVPDLAAWKAEGRRMTMITAYDVTFARLVDEAGIDMILVGDSVGMVVQGTSNTIPVDLEEMAYHVRCVARANTKALVIGDLPFGSYQISPEQGVESSIVLMKNGAQCIKLEVAVVSGASKLTCPSERKSTRVRQAINGLVKRGAVGLHEDWLWRN